MTRFTYATPLLLGALVLSACPGDDVPADTEGSSSGDTTMDPTSMGPTTTPPTTTTVDPDSSSSDSATTVADPCADVDCGPGEQCIGGTCFDCGDPSCESACGAGETCQCPKDDLCCDVGFCAPPVCGSPLLEGNYADCLDDMGMTSDEPCDGAACVVDSPANPTAAVCVASGCDEACQCPVAPATGDAVVNCEDVTGDRVNDCWLECSGGATCPDGMICFGGFICLWSDLAPTEVPLYGDCANVQGATCEDGFCVQAPTGAVCTAACADVMDCEPAPLTGDAPITCVDVTGDMMPECILDCSMGDACPDGMDCFGGFVCIWPEIVPPPPPASGYGDCVDNPMTTCEAGEDTCLTDAGGTAGACSLSGCVDAVDCPGAPLTGNAPVTCGDLGGGNTCYLDCAGGETCPNGTVCTVVGGGSACLWTEDGFLLDENFERGSFRPGWSVIDVDGLTPAGAVSFVSDAFVVADQFEPGMNFGAYSTSWYTPAGQANDWMVTPQVTLGAASMLTWDARAPDPAYPDGYEVRISTAGPVVADFMANPALFTIANEGAMFMPHSVDLAAAGYMNQDVYIAWRNNSNDEFILVVDNVQITE